MKSRMITTQCPQENINARNESPTQLQTSDAQAKSFDETENKQECKAHDSPANCKTINLMKNESSRN